MLLQSVIEGTLFLVFIVSNKLDSLSESKREKSHEANKSLSTVYDTVPKYNHYYWGYKYIRHLKPATVKVPAESRQVIKLVF